MDFNRIRDNQSALEFIRLLLIMTDHAVDMTCAQIILHRTHCVQKAYDLLGLSIKFGHHQNWIKTMSVPFLTVCLSISQDLNKQAQHSSGLCSVKHDYTYNMGLL